MSENVRFIAGALFVVGSTLVVTSMWALGVTGTYLGEQRLMGSFGLLVYGSLADWEGCYCTCRWLLWYSDGGQSHISIGLPSLSIRLPSHKKVIYGEADLTVSSLSYHQRTESRHSHSMSPITQCTMDRPCVSYPRHYGESFRNPRLLFVTTTADDVLNDDFTSYIDYVFPGKLPLLVLC